MKTVRQVGYLQGSYQDARSTTHKKVPLLIAYVAQELTLFWQLVRILKHNSDLHYQSVFLSLQ